MAKALRVPARTRRAESRALDIELSKATKLRGAPSQGARIASGMSNWNVGRSNVALARGRESGTCASRADANDSNSNRMKPADTLRATLTRD
ncbi:hypothetical protein D3C83_90620 [compost metagenome]